MNSTTFKLTALLYAVPIAIQILVLLGGIIFGATKMTAFPRPAKWLVLGLVFILASHSLGWIGRLILVRQIGAEEFVFYNGLISLVLVALNAVGMITIMGAVFVARDIKPWSQKRDHSDNLDAQFTPTTDPNPYTTPKSE